MICGLIKTSLSRYVSLCLILLLTACANKQPASTQSIQQKAAAQANEANFTPEQAIEKVEAMLAKAKESELPFYAPLHMSQAEKSLEEARQYLISPPKEIQNAALMSAIAAQNFLQKGHENKALVKETLAEALNHKEVLIELGAPQVLKDDYEDAVDELKDLIILLESGKTGEAITQQKDVLATMSRVEIDTLKKTHLGPAREWLAKADDIDADDFAAATFDKAEYQLSQADQFIENNFRDRDGVAKAGFRALKAAQFAYYISQEAERLLALTHEDAELKALSLMEQLNTIARRTTPGELAPQSLHSGAQTLAGRVELLKEQQLLLAKRIKELEAKIQEASSDDTIAGPTTTGLSGMDEEVKVIRVLPGFEDEQTQVSTEDQTLASDEQSFDSVEVVGDSN